MAIENLVRHFGAVADPRCGGKIEHRLTDILVIAVCAVIACAESWNDIALYGRSKLDWLRTFLELPNGIPSHDTFRRVFMLIDPEAFEACFTAWAGSLAAGFEREVVAIDGKTLRRSFDRRREQRPAAPGQCLGQRAGPGAGPALRRRTSPTRSPPSRHCWTSWSCGQHRDPGRHGMPDRDCRADPGARGRLPADAQGQSSAGPGGGGGAFRRALLSPGRPGPSRLRCVRGQPTAAWSAAGCSPAPRPRALDALSGWPGLRTVLAVESIRSVNGTDKVESEIRYFLSSWRR